MSDQRRMWQQRWERGQSTLEYILVVAAILVAVLIAANEVVKPAVKQTMDDSTNVMKDATAKLKPKLGLE